MRTNTASGITFRVLMGLLCLILLPTSNSGTHGHAVAADKTLITIDDLYRQDAPTNPVLLPAGAGIIYSRRWSDRESRQVRFSLWKALPDGTQCRLEEDEPDARQPLLSPDGQWIVFLSTRNFSDGIPAFTPVPAYSDPATDIWVIPTAGGKAVPLCGPGKPYGRVFSDPFYGNVAFSPDGRKLVFVADDLSDPRTTAELRNNVHVVREDQGEGYEGYRTARIWIADLKRTLEESAAEKVTQITQDEFWYGDPQWTPLGDSLIVHANRTADRESVRYSINHNYDLWQIRLSSGELTQLTDGPGPEVSPRISTDGRSLLYLSIPRCGSHMDVFNLAVGDLRALPQIGQTGLKSRIVFDHHRSGQKQPPHLPPMFPLPRDCWLTNSLIYFNAPDRTTQRTQVIDLNAGPVAMSDSKPESHLSQRARSTELRSKLLPQPDLFLANRIVGQGEVVEWAVGDGQMIEGIITRPTLPACKPPYKMVLFPHGGPHSRSSVGFDLTVQVLAASGYVVFQPNYRGSAGYGQAFIDADRMDLGAQDMQDMLTGISHLVKQGLVDPNRQFLYGSSYGGYSTCMLIGQTRQFRAAVPQNAVTDLTMMWSLTDIQSWTEWEFGARPWEAPQIYRDHSPLTFASQVKTPTLILHAANDRRCPLPMGIAYYRALKSTGVQTEMVIYPDEGHPIKQLPHIEDVLTRVLKWFSDHDAK